MTTPQKEDSTVSAFAYMRVSGIGQVEGDGFERQLSTIERYASLHRIRVVEVFREEGISGTTDLDGRKALPALFSALESNGVKTVLIEKLDRMARDLMVQETIIANMQKNGYNLISAMEPDLCSTDPSRVLMRQIFGAIAQYDKAMIVMKLKAGLERKRMLTGKAQGRHSYGVKPGEREIYERIVSMRAEGFIFQKIADVLNAEGIEPRGTKKNAHCKWHPGTVAKILSR